MKVPGSRHYSEEELLMHYLQEETADVGREISAHLRDCGECTAVFEEYGDLVEKIRTWPVPDFGEEVVRAQKASLMARYRGDHAAVRPRGWFMPPLKSLQAVWNYALENPLPALAYVAIAVAFALERTIATFRLDQVLPGATEVYEILRQVF